MNKNSPAKGRTNNATLILRVIGKHKELESDSELGNHTSRDESGSQLGSSVSDEGVSELISNASNERNNGSENEA
ncbi:hypothetical protein AX774_g8232, partial [Zancudomyces culisetae]